MSNSSQRSRQSRRLLAVVPVAVIAALALSSCSADEKASSEPPGVGELPPVFTPSPQPTPYAGTESTSDTGVVDQAQLSVTLQDTSGANVGKASFAGAGTGTTVTLDVSGLTPGFHSLAVTSAGVCEADDNFASAGEVLNDPANSTAGLPKDGELPTILVDSEGNGTLTTSTGGFKVEELTNEPGTALVIGEDEDSTSRVACGVIGSQ